MDENIKVSQLPSADTITDNDLLMIVQSGENKKATSSQMVDLFEGAVQDKYIETTRTSANHFAFTSPKDPEDGDVFRVKIATNTDEGNPVLKCNNGNYTIIANDYVALYSKNLSDKYIDVVYASIYGGLHHFKLVEPTSTLQLTNDSGYITKNNIQDNLVNVGTSVDTDYRTNLLSSKNLFDTSKILIGVFIDSTNGTTTSQSNRNSLDYTRIKPSTNYVVSGLTIKNTAFYDINKTFISSVQNVYTFTTPSNAHYLRFGFDNSVSYSQAQLEEGNTATTYEPFIQKTINIDNNKFSDTINVGTTIDTSNRVNVLYSQNLWDKSSILWFKNNNTSSFDDRNDNNTTRIKSTPISIQGGKTYTISGLPSGITLNASGVICYDKNKTYLGNNYAPYTNGTFTLPSNVVYIVIMCNGENFTDATNTLMQNANIMLNEGSTALSYEPYVSPSINIDGEEIYNSNINQYSLYEIDTGMKWIDGKPIYRKVIDCGYLPNASSKNVAIGYSLNQINIVRLYGTARENTGYTISIPHVSSGQSNSQVQCEVSTNGIFLRTGVNYSNLYCYVTLEYTKTTD